MFTKFRVQNFKTHLDTEIELKDLTLLIGSNNSGKTNLLKAISFFSEIVRANFHKRNEEVIFTNLLSNKHSLHSDKDIILGYETTLIYLDKEVKMSYSLIIHTIGLNQLVELSEIMSIEIDEEIIKFKNEKCDIYSLKLHKLIEDSNNKTINDFKFKHKVYEKIKSLATMYYFNFYPQLLREHSKIDKNIELKFNEPNRIDISNFNELFAALIIYIKENEKNSYSRFLAFIRTFEPSLIGVEIEDDKLVWQFDLGNHNSINFDADAISDGLLKATAVSLICALEKKPSLIMLEEIENGINQSKVKEFLGWLKYISDNGKNTQFILTSHSPSVIREFSDNLDSVYTFHLKRKKGYVSEVTNLNEALKKINRLGVLKEGTVEEVDGVLHVRKYALTELFYNGILREL
ncbi:AAA family ATPase [Bernardetia sp. ABR2-2B]|uniref:AAA family ATPase n=1 Tax=Bernardetia sp. ABR2-2B TaxID=3127472 RepID=UPI0030D0F1F5